MRRSFVAFLLACTRATTVAPPPATAPVGAACGSSRDCGAGLACLVDSAIPGGECTRVCRDGACPAGATCTAIRGLPVCLAACAADADCRAEYQCRGGACREPCAGARDCGPGARCEMGRCVPGSPLGAACAADADCAGGLCLGPDGVCSAPCARAADCAAPLACRVRRSDDNHDGFYDRADAHCLASTGAALGAACAADGDCASGVCRLGLCADPCATDADCPDWTACATIGPLAGDVAPTDTGVCFPSYPAEPRVSVCVPIGAQPAWPLGTVQSGATFLLDVPAGAVSFSVTARTAGDPRDALAGVLELIAPGGVTLFSPPATADGFWSEPIRYYPDDVLSTLMAPNTPDVPAPPGTYCFSVGTLGADVPVDADLRMKIARGGDVAGGTLDLNVYFLDLSGLGCGVGDLNASSAPSHAVMQGALDRMFGTIYAQAGIARGTVTYHDVAAPELVNLPTDDGGTGVQAAFNSLLSLGDASGDSVDVFFTRTIQNALGIAGGVPGPPGLHGAPHAGCAISMDAACGDVVGNVMAHEIGHVLGLFHVYEFDGHWDPIEDTPAADTNFMAPAEHGGTDLTPGQAFVMRRFPAVR